MFIFEQACTATDIHARSAGSSSSGIPSLFRLLRSDKSKILMLWRRAFFCMASNGHSSSRAKDWQPKCFLDNRAGFRSPDNRRR